MNWGRIWNATSVIAPMIVPFGGTAGAIASAVTRAVTLAEQVKDASGGDKHAIARTTVLEALDIAEDASGVDLLNDQAVSEAVDRVIEADVAVRVAYASLKAVVESAQQRHELTGQRLDNWK